MHTTVAERVELGLLFDHSDWARSVRWSCGRPGARPLVIRSGHGQVDPVSARLWWLVGAGIVEPRHTFKVTAV